MPLTVIDSMDNAAPWQALAPDGVTPSTQLAMTIADAPPRAGGGGVAAYVSASTGAQDHILRRSLGPFDLSTFDQLRVWLYSDRPADGTPARPFFLELRLGSAALPLDNAGNTWLRYLPIFQPRTWEPAFFSLADLPAAVRTAASVAQLRSVDVSAPFTCILDDLVAVRAAMIGDVDAALLARLDGGLSLKGKAVPAVLHPPVGPIAQARPYIEITHYDVAFAPDRTASTAVRCDFTATGYSLRAPGAAFELFYEIAAVADDRTNQSQMLEFILGALSPRGDLVVNGDPLPMDTVTVEPEDQIGGSRTDRIPLFYRIGARLRGGAPQRVSGARTVKVEGDVRA